MRVKSDNMLDAGCSDDAFLGGRLRILQVCDGYRAGLDSVMLAAAVPAKPGALVLEAGLGVGVASLCLVSRVEDVCVTGVEIDPHMAMLAAGNATRNGHEQDLQVVIGDMSGPTSALDELKENHFDHAFSNPPFYLENNASPPNNDARRRAHMRREGELEIWIRRMVGKLKPGGSLTLILPATALDEVLTSLRRRVGDVSVFPLFPHSGSAANRVIVRSIKGSRGPLRLLRGLVLHGADGALLPAIDEILRNGAALTFDSSS